MVATPIGNLEDMSARAVRVLGEVDRIACEDTRVTRKLLAHHGLDTRTLRHDAHNAAASTEGILALLEAGECIALVSDAGTPCVSDPGVELVQAVRDAGYPVVPIPGPSALLAALSASGLPVHPTTFHGFLPKRRGLLDRLWASLGDGTHAFFVPARDLGATLSSVAAASPEAQVVVARELTKQHETWYRGDARSLRDAWSADDGDGLGEAVLLIHRPTVPTQISDEAIVAQLTEALGRGLRMKDAAAEVAEAMGIPRRRAYQLGLTLDA